MTAMLNKILFLLFVTITATFGELTNKCTITDDNCKAVMYHNKAIKLANGDPTKGIPPLDPVKTENVKVEFPESVVLTLVEGDVKGFASCKMKDFKTNLQLKLTSLNLTCEIEFDGQYKITVPTDAPQKLGLAKAIDLEGTGKGKVRLENYQLSMDFHVYLIKQDGQVFINVEELHTSHTVTGTTLFIAEDNILVDKDTTEKVVTYINKKSELIQNTFAAAALDKATLFYNKFGEKHINVHPANYFFSGELDSFVSK